MANQPAMFSPEELDRLPGNVEITATLPGLSGARVWTQYVLEDGVFWSCEGERSLFSSEFFSANATITKMFTLPPEVIRSVFPPHRIGVVGGD